MIVSYLEDKHSNWDVNVPRIANSLRFREEQEGAENIDEEAQAKWRDNLAKVHEFYNTINDRIKRAQEKQAKYYTKKHRVVDLQVGELVLHRNRILSNAANQVAATLAGCKPITKAGEDANVSSEQSEVAEDSDSEPSKHQGYETPSRRITRTAARKKATAKECAIASEDDTVAQL
ncbi:hypothetical protein TKK_0007936 [Trichogramma kaykai]